MYDQNQLVQNFAQMSLMNNASSENLQANMVPDLSMYGNFEGQLSSIPPHMKPQKVTRSNSISGAPPGFSKLDLGSQNSETTGSNPSYMGGSFLFNQLSAKASKEDGSFCK